MSQHPSLRSSDKDKKQRSVLKRYERIKMLQDKEKWDEKNDSVFGLPKVKVTRFKIKKEKAAAAEGAETAEGAAAGAPAAAPAAPGKEASKAAGKEGTKAAAAEAKKETKK
ncbi:MAG: small basic protein [Candidatus Omnitrophota bacterium]|jgi:small basic protein (TIGR04137 family)|nr:small basic protein [Candidatus Omnitrophota bacterium]